MGLAQSKFSIPSEQLNYVGREYQPRRADSQGNLGNKVQRFRRGGESVQHPPPGLAGAKCSVYVDGFEKYPGKETEKEPFPH